MENKISGKATAWGLRLSVPAPILKGVGIQVGDEVEWSLGEREGKKIAILQKADEEAKEE